MVSLEANSVNSLDLYKTLVVNYFSCRGVSSNPLNDNRGDNGWSGDHQSEETEDERWGRFGDIVLDWIDLVVLFF